MITYDDIVGHERQKGILGRAVQSGRVHHAYMFSGPEGVGKMLVASAFAAALNCERVEEGAPCGRCPACRKTGQGNHPDARVIDPGEGRIKIEEVREIQHHAQFSPYEGNWKVYLLRSADRMTLQAANALLKTLEEPRPSTVFVLVTENPHLLPLTVLSRCQRIVFWPLPSDVVARELEQRLGLEPETARLAAHLSGGSLGRALIMEVEDLMKRRLALLESLRSLPGAGPAQALDLAKNLIEPDALVQCEIVKTWYRDQVIVKTTGREKDVINRDMVEAIRREADQTELPSLFAKIRTIGETQYWLGLSANPRMALETMALSLAV